LAPTRNCRSFCTSDGRHGPPLTCAFAAADEMTSVHARQVAACGVVRPSSNRTAIPSHRPVASSFDKSREILPRPANRPKNNLFLHKRSLRPYYSSPLSQGLDSDETAFQKRTAFSILSSVLS